ncbi:MAG TPA: chromate transporter [Stenomitos sp.]
MSDDCLPSSGSPVQDACAYADLSRAQKRQRLREIAQVFLKLGSIAFGGPVAHIAMMDDEVVKRRGWLSQERLLDLLGATNLIPGPNSTELAIHIGYERGGIAGLMVAGVSFILPSLLLVWGLAIAYVHYQSVPQVDWLLYGIKPAIVAIVLQALWKLGRKAIKGWLTGSVVLATVVAFAGGGSELVLLLLAGASVVLFRRGFSQHTLRSTGLPSLMLALPAPVSAPMAAASGLQIFWVFLKVGSILYGSGYVLLAFLQRDLVDHNHWLTTQQLLDAVAIGQVTPGPVFTTATFIGYLLNGHVGALAATCGIFLPSFVFVLALNPWVAKLRASQTMSAFLDGVNAASLGLMAAVTYTLGRAAVVDGLTLFWFGVSAIAVLRFNLNAMGLILGGGIVGFAAHLLHWI